MSLLVVQMHGEPGSGKSTVARAIAPRISAVVMDKDVIKAALLRAGIAEDLAAPAAYDVYFAQAESVLALGHNLILDNPVFWPSVERRWLDITDAAGSPRILIECVCPDRDQLLQRLSTREIVESQPRDPLDLVRRPGSMPTRFEPRLVLDTTRQLPDLVDEALVYIDAVVSGTLLPQEARGRP